MDKSMAIDILSNIYNIDIETIIYFLENNSKNNDSKEKIQRIMI